MSGVRALPYSELPRTYHRWKWRILLSFCGFYLFLYLGRFNFWPVAPLVQEDLALTHLEIGLINAMLLWGFGLGDLVHGRLAETYGLRLWVLGGAVLTTVFNWVTSYGVSTMSIAIPWGMAGFVNAACWSPGISMISQLWPRRDRGMAVALGFANTVGRLMLEHRIANLHRDRLHHRQVYALALARPLAVIEGHENRGGKVIATYRIGDQPAGIHGVAPFVTMNRGES